MAKFKVGDIIIPHGYGSTKYKILSVEPITYTYEVIQCDTHPIIIGSNSRDSINSVDICCDLFYQPKFQVHDVLTINSDNSYQLLVMSNDNGNYLIKYMAVPNEKIYLLSDELYFQYETIEKDCSLLMKNNSMNKDIDDVIKEKKCTCSSYDLFNKGCVCGAIKKYRPTYY